MLPMMQEEKKLILLNHYFLYVLSDGGKAKTHSFKTLFFYLVYDGAREKTHSLTTLFFYNFSEKRLGKMIFKKLILF